MSDLTAETCVQVDFKIKPTLIPSAAIKKLENFSHSSGGLGDVWKCSMSTPSGMRLVAVKSIRVTNSNNREILCETGRRIRREAYVWMQLSHNHILSFEGITDDFGLLPALVSLWMENGALNDYLVREYPQMSEHRKLELVQQVASGLSYLHGKDVAHGDLTPNNILIDGSGNLRLSDFGLSMVIAESGNATFGSLQVGGTRWMAPEFVGCAEDREEPQSPLKPTKAGDIYSFGCVMLQIFLGQEPYSWIKHNVRVIAAIAAAQDPFRGVEIDIKEAYRLLSSRCLSRKPEGRPSALDIKNIVYPVKESAKVLCIIGALPAHSSLVSDKTCSHNALGPHLIQGTHSRPFTILDRHRYYYPCQWRDGSKLCNYMIQADSRQLHSHLKEHHGVRGGQKDIHRCLWADCSRHVPCDNLARHLISHLGMKYRCLNCSIEVARPECARAHQKKRHVCSEAAFQVIPGPDAHIFI